MSESIALTPLEADAVVRIMEEAAQVHRRHQFFIWTQSQFQTLLPHKVMLCGSYQRQRRVLVFEPFNSVVLSHGLQTCLLDPEGALMRSAVAQWVSGGGRAIAVDRSMLEGSARDAADRLGEELSCEFLLLHGVARPQREAEIESLFVFLLGKGSAASRLVQRLEMLLPQVHITWRHVEAIERSLQNAPSAAQRLEPAEASERRVVTERERQILRWMREGKSNLQIGEVLSISPLTVKNHVQNILRKLNASNRAQAVAQAMSLNLLKFDDNRSEVA